MWTNKRRGLRRSHFACPSACGPSMGKPPSSVATCRSSRFKPSSCTESQANEPVAHFHRSAEILESFTEHAHTICSGVNFRLVMQGVSCFPLASSSSSTNAAFRLEMITNEDPHKYNLQVQLNNQHKISTLKSFWGPSLAIAHVSVGSTISAEEIKAELHKTRVTNLNKEAAQAP